MRNKEALKKLPIFSNLDDEELGIILKQTQEGQFQKGQILFDQGDPGGKLYIVLVGAVEIGNVLADGLVKPVVTLREGQMFGEMSLIDKNPRDMQAKIVEDTVLLTLTTERFDEITSSYKELGTKILKFLVQCVVDRIRITNETLRRNIQWGLSVSGALDLGLQHLITDEMEILVDLNSGKSLQGTLVKFDKNDSGYLLYIESKGDKISVIPYHSVSSISFSKQVDTRTYAEKS